jgi:hypothetical protein
MKPFKLFLLLLTVLTYSSCKENEEDVYTDPKEKYIGDWESNGWIKVPDLYIDLIYGGKFTIEKDTSDGMLRITKYDDFVTNIPVYVTDTGHYYTTFTRLFSPYSDTVTLEQIGAGFTEVDPVWGLEIIEWGPLVYIVDGIRYTGTWSQNAAQRSKEK